MSVTIIIVNWNTVDYLRDCLASIKENVLNPQVIVVDNGSKDQSRAMVKKHFPEVHLINSGANIGFGRANNLALPYVKTEYIMFLNPDTRILKGSVDKMLTFMKTQPHVGLLGPKMLNIDNSVQQVGSQWYHNPLTKLIEILFLTEETEKKYAKLLRVKDPDTNGYVKKIFGGCFLVRKSIIDKIGCFDERFFMYCEDVDLCRRIRKAGWEIYYLSDAVILHVGHGADKHTINNFIVLMRCESINKYIRKYSGYIGSILYRLVVLFGSIIRLTLLYVIAGIKFSVSTKNKVSMIKYITMIKWSLYLAKPTIVE